MSYLYLVLAIVGELIGSSLLKASEGFSKLSYWGNNSFRWLFFFVTFTENNPLNTAYAIWSGLGIVLLQLFQF